jgi:transcriptional antiterminator RfaH
MFRWFLVHTKPAGEGVARENLERQAFRVYYPRLVGPARVRGRWVERITPLFPRYLFLCLDVGRQTLAPVGSTKGVAGIVRFGAEYGVVPDAVVTALRARADPVSGLHRLRSPEPFTPGSRVRIVAGAFEGVEGILQRESSEERVIILLRVLGQQTPVRVPAAFVMPVGEGARPGKHAYG